ncbi:MAG: ethanolamine ammonia lyase-activating protein [Candidatus Binatia bacterium]
MENSTVVKGELRRVNFYEDFMRAEGLPILRGFFVEDLLKVELAPWKRKGGLGAFIDLEGAGGATGAYLCEIPPGGRLNPQRFMIEEMIYILRGKGATTVWQDEKSKRTFEWSVGSHFAVPLNAWHQYFNGQGNEPVRFLAVNNAPVVLNLFHDLDFVFNNPYVFSGRFHGEEDYFSGQGREYPGRVWESNFISDVQTFRVLAQVNRGGRSRNMHFELADGAMASHVSEFPVGTYKKAHRHGAGYQIVILGGRGYTLLWPEGEKRTRVDWETGSLFVPPQMWFHQHFNSGESPARYLAFHWSPHKYEFIKALHTEGQAKNVKEGGNQIEYEDEDPEIHDLYERELERSGVRCKMKTMAPRCKGTE